MHSPPRLVSAAPETEAIREEASQLPAIDEGDPSQRRPPRRRRPVYAVPAAEACLRSLGVGFGNLAHTYFRSFYQGREVAAQETKRVAAGKEP